MSEVRALTADEWRRLRLARMAAVEAMPYFARALFALVPVAEPGLNTFAVDKFWRLYVDPEMLGGDGGWTISQAGVVLLHEVSHVLREHGVRAETVDSVVHHKLWNYAADAEINDDLIAAGLALPGRPITPARLGCEDGHAAEVYYRHLVPPGTPPPDSQDGDGSGGSGDDDDGEDEGYGCGSGAGDDPVPGELPAAADLGSGTGISSAAADLVRIAVARAVQQEIQHGGAGRGTMPAGLVRWAAHQLTPAVVPWPKVLRAAVRRAVEDQQGQVHHSWRRPNRRAPKGVLLPTLRAPKIAVDLIFDTSASVGDADLAAAYSETRAVLRRTGATVRMLCCDAAATEARPVRSLSDVTLVGGGGTDMRVGIEAALAARPKANVLVLFTDGGTPWPERRLPVPMIVALIGAHAVDTAPAWAKTVRVTPAGQVAA
ncbi:VWA-like domain-containing protein [Mycobacterium sp.]|uniref:vWA domain-containing protein n=1 Tax=Mycobacterium sp. TaxID=1785 RepID=UPI0025CFD820|nr:VWA-like domain-containing protein [Mycobacterium sp.]